MAPVVSPSTLKLFNLPIISFLLQFVIASLNVIAMTVKKFLPPNLSLLLESKPGSSMDELGKLIYMKMHDLSWEVRDSALELLLVCTEISFVSKYTLTIGVTPKNRPFHLLQWMS